MDAGSVREPHMPSAQSCSANSSHLSLHGVRGSANPSQLSMWQVNTHEHAIRETDSANLVEYQVRGAASTLRSPGLFQLTDASPAYPSGISVAIS